MVDVWGRLSTVARQPGTGYQHSQFASEGSYNASVSIERRPRESLNMTSWSTPKSVPILYVQSAVNRPYLRDVERCSFPLRSTSSPELLTFSSV